MKDIKTFIIGFLTCACMFLIMGQTNKNLGDIKVDSITLETPKSSVSITPTGIGLKNNNKFGEHSAGLSADGFMMEHGDGFEMSAHRLIYKNHYHKKSTTVTPSAIIMEVGDDKLQSNFYVGTSNDGKETWVSHWNDGKEHHIGAKPK